MLKQNNYITKIKFSYYNLVGQLFVVNNKNVLYIDFLKIYQDYLNLKVFKNLNAFNKIFSLDSFNFRKKLKLQKIYDYFNLLSNSYLKFNHIDNYFKYI